VNRAASLCKQWTETKTESVAIVPHTNCFVVNQLNKVGINTKFHVKWDVQARHIKVTGSTARLREAVPWLQSHFQDLHMQKIAIRSDQGGYAIRLLNKDPSLRDLRKTHGTCIDVDGEEVWVTGFSRHVKSACAVLQELLEERSETIELPRLLQREDLSWKFVRSILGNTELKAVVQDSSGPGHVDLQGYCECVAQATETLRQRLCILTADCLSVPPDKKGLIIGKGGATLKSFVKEFDVVIVVGDDDDDDDFVYVAGADAAVKRVLGDISDIISDSPSSGGRSYPTGVSGPTIGKGKDKGDVSKGASHKGKGKSAPPFCSFFQTGHCRKGEQCPFRHEKDPAQVLEGVPDKQLQHRTGSASKGKGRGKHTIQVCRYFQQGRCTKGEQCQYKHEKE